MADVALKRMSRLMDLAPVAPSAQRLSLSKALDDSVRAAVLEATGLPDAVHRMSEIYFRLLRFSPPSDGPLRQPVEGSIDAEHAEAAALYFLSLGVEDERERSAIRRSTGMPPGLRERARQLARREA